MTGTGTQADPYVVDNWEDFQAALNTENAYVECVEGLTFDLNDYASVIELTINAGVHVSGNGLIIRNAGDFSIFEKGPGTSYIQDVNFVDLHVLTSLNFIIYKSNLSTEYTRCNFKVFSQKDIKFCNSYVSNPNKFHSCNISLISNGRASGFLYADLNDCNIELDNVASLGSCNMKRCYVHGKVSSWAYTTANESIFEIEFSGTSISQAGTNLVVNKDLCPNAVSNTVYKALTTAEIRNPQKLYEAGIPINPTGA